MGVREDLQRPLLATLTAFLTPRHMLLVLDNCEHLRNACAELTASLLQSCPHLQILATSREALDVPGEIWWRVPSLSCPKPDTPTPHPATHPAPARRLVTGDALLQYEATRLFVERARARRPGFDPSEQQAQAIAHICDRLDGIPLAIELAAALLPALTVPEIAARLEDRFQLLTGGSRVLLPRHQTLRAAMDWSYTLLREPEQAALRRLAVFADGWTRDAAELVCQGEGLDAGEIAGRLAHLVATSLVVDEGSERMAGGQTRYGLLETVRHYARLQLDASGETLLAQQRHWDWCMALADGAVKAFVGPEQGAWLDRLELEHNNLRAALAWSLSAGGATREGLRLAAALWRFWYVRGYFAEGRHWLEELLAQSTAASGVPTPDGNAVPRSPTLAAPTALPPTDDGEPPRDSARARALTGAGSLAFIQGDLARATTLQQECLALYREYDSTFGIAAALHNLANVLFRRGDLVRAVALLEEALVLQRQLNRKDILAAFLNSLGNALMHQGHHQRATALFTESLALCRELGDSWATAMPLRNLGLVARSQGDYERAAILFEESLALSQQTGSVQDTTVAINDLGQVACAQGDYEQAIALHDESLALARQLGDQWSVASALYGLGQVALHRNQHRAAAAWFVESLTLWGQQGGKEGIGQSLEGLALAHIQSAQGTRARAHCTYAARLLGAAEALRTAASTPLPPVALPAYQHAVAAVRERLGPEAYTFLWTAGAAMPLDAVIVYATEAPLAA